MKRALVLLSGISAAAALYIFWQQLASLAARRRLSSIRGEDLYYSHLSGEELASRDLVDLNEADEAQLNSLGLDSESRQRLMENRPYRSKLELLSRMVIGEDTYAMIRDKIAVARGDEPVKTA